MISKVKLFLLNILVISWLGQSAGSESCFGLFYQTYFDSYYGLYGITTSYRHFYFYYNSYYGSSAKFCPDRCCTITDGATYYYYYYNNRLSYSYRTCCYSYVDVTLSYKSSGKSASTTGLIIGCTIGGTLFAVMVIFSLLVARCMYRERKRIDPTSTSKESNPTDESFVTMADSPEVGTSFTITTSSTTTKPATEIIIT
ncbi:uncharacterized protein LOC117339664 [Pecten maximus]|uniref:uncharacterized protein LOC117339664 n=1 Tax=Pecten maximus TaxID=6579 RepID=UPI0014583CCE|nr:uncharacterized protein LOC117339664 [Pecten maximus]